MLSLNHCRLETFLELGKGFELRAPALSYAKRVTQNFANKTNVVREEHHRSQ